MVDIPTESDFSTTKLYPSDGNTPAAPPSTLKRNVKRGLVALLLVAVVAALVVGVLSYKTSKSARFETTSDTDKSYQSSYNAASCMTQLTMEKPQNNTDDFNFELVINSKSIVVSWHNNTIHLEAHDITLSPDEKTCLKETASNVIESMTREETSSDQFFLKRIVVAALSHLARVPHDWVISSMSWPLSDTSAAEQQQHLQSRNNKEHLQSTKQHLQAFGNEGILCMKYGWYYYAEFDSPWYRYQIVDMAGAGACRGQCGAGCSWSTVGYYKDCFDHDNCIYRLGGNAYDPYDTNCGNEWRDAVDDTIYGILHPTDCCRLFGYC
jgi:hypothetical protein